MFKHLPPPPQSLLKWLNLPIFVLFFALTSCEQAQGITPAIASETSSARMEQDDKVLDKITFNGEYLEFKTPADFDAFLEALPNKKRNELDEWERSLGFTSMRNYYETAIDQSQRYYEWLRNNMNESLAKEIRKNGHPHSDYVKKMQVSLSLTKRKILASISTTRVWLLPSTKMVW